MSESPEDLDRLLVRMDDATLYEHAIRLAEGVDPASVLADLVASLLRVAEVTGSGVMLQVEPTGDSCDTGNWVEIGCDMGVVWAEMTPRPQRFGGCIPPEVDAGLGAAGWVEVTYDEIGAVDDEDELEGPVRRLLGGATPAAQEQWATQVVDAVEKVMCPNDRRWFLTGSLDVSDAGPFGHHPFVRTGLEGRWSVDLGALLDPMVWERAVWRLDTEAGARACELGLHQFHEPPCSTQ